MMLKSLLHAIFFYMTTLSIFITSHPPLPLNISIEYEESQYVIKTKLVLISNSNLTLSAILDINSFSSWISQNQFSIDMTNFSDINPSSGRFADSVFYGLSAKAMIDLSNNQLNNFPLSIIQTIIGPTPFYYQGILGLSSSSHLMTYLSKELALKKVFAISFISRTKGYLLLGGPPEAVILNQLFASSCNLKRGSNNNIADGWGCALQNVVKGDSGRLTVSDHDPSKRKFEIFKKYSSVFENKEASTMLFDTVERFILAPDDFIIFLQKYYFKESFDKSTCQYNKLNKSYYFFCSNAEIPYLSSLKFIIDDYEYQMNTSDLFFNLGNMALFAIKLNKDSNSWVIGNSFFRKYTTVFDADNATISFYSENIQNKVVITEGDYGDAFNSAANGKEMKNLILLLIKIMITLGCFSIAIQIILQLSLKRINYFVT